MTPIPETLKQLGWNCLAVVVCAGMVVLLCGWKLLILWQKVCAKIAERMT